MANVDEIIDKFAKCHDNKVAIAFTKSIGELLKLNGVTAHYTECNSDVMTEDEISKQYGIVFDSLDFTEHDKGFKDEIKRLIDIDFERLDNVIRKYVPSGRKVHEEENLSVASDIIEKLHCKEQLKNINWLKRSCGTLGGGNHFIEIDSDSNGVKYLVIHSGSRNIGKQVAEIYQQMAIDDISGKSNFKQDSEKLIAEYKKCKREREISKAIKELKQSYKTNATKIPRELSYLVGKHREMYLHDMKLCQEFAEINRRAIQSIICYYMDWKVTKKRNNFKQFTTTLNTIQILFAKVLFLQKRAKRY